MIKLPKSLKIKRAKKAEESLLQRSREWLEAEKRDPRIHVSDLLAPMRSYWQRKIPKPLSDKLVTTFLIGKVLHAFVISAVDGEKNTTLKSDEGSKYSKALDIVYSIDKIKKGIPRELKTTRSYYEPKTHDDLANYCEQLLCYMVAEKQTKGQLWILLLNFKDKSGRTSPVYRCYTITVSPDDLKAYEKSMVEARKQIQIALKKSNPSKLPLCVDWQCGSKENCAWWDDCKPKGRYGKPKKEWKV